MRILFWGTPDFAVPPLRALLGEGHDVVGVVTQPDKPRGRSRTQLDPSPVKVVALEEGLPVLQPLKPRGDEFLEQMRELAPDISVVVAYGHILPKVVIDLPPQGTLNIHASLLPALRGAAPIQASILEGHEETGVTIMQMVPALDAGDMLHVLRTPIGAQTTYGELHDQLAEMGALAIVQALAMIESGVSRAVSQDDAASTYAPKIDRTMARLDFAKRAELVSRTARAFDPRPGAFAALRGVDVKLFGACVVGDGSDDALDEPTRASPPGTVRSANDDGLVVRCGEGAVRFLDVQPSGKPRMTVAAWSRGRGVNVGDMFDLPGEAATA
ncbi:methionyl-tRNA formyltransferase [Gemmatimonas sp.]|uniref:methionyl-tRNA formyltransferase n=1 Tax=Gemmatimonas sp. TaxID=1962908 RepID=UPI003DA2A3C5